MQCEKISKVHSLNKVKNNNKKKECLDSRTISITNDILDSR